MRSQAITFPGWVAMAALGVLLALHGHASAQATLATGAGERITDMLGTAELPAGCDGLENRVSADQIRSRYRCDGERFEIVLVHHRAAPAEANRTSYFALRIDEGTPPGLTEALLRAIRGHERADLWREAPSVSTARDASAQIRAGTWICLGLAPLAILFGALLSRRRNRGGRAETAEEGGPRLFALGALWLGAALVMGATFRFHMDDFLYLSAAAADPWASEAELRVLGVRIPFFLGTQLPGTGPFVAFNLAAYAGVLLASAALCRRLGGTWREAALAALIIGLQPGFFGLVRHASGFQQLLALTLVLVTLLALDHAAERPDARGRAGLVMMAVGLAVLAVLTKYATASLIPIAAPLLMARSARSWRPALTRTWPVLLVGALMLALVLYAELDPMNDRAGLGALGRNSAEMGLGLGWLLARCLVASLIVLAARAAEDRRRAVGEVLRSLVQPVERMPFAMLTLTTAGLFTIPFLLNQRYYKDYYAAFAGVFVALLGARAIARAWPARAHGGLAIALALCFVPVDPLEEAFAVTPRNGVDAWATEAAATLTTAPAARSIRVLAQCPGSGDTRESQRLLAEYHAQGGLGQSIRWAAGLGHAVEITLEGPAELTLLYCESERPRFALGEDSGSP